MTKQERLYFILAALPVLLQCAKPPTDYWGWMILVASMSYQGFLAVKAARSVPDKTAETNQPTSAPASNTMKTIATIAVVIAFVTIPLAIISCAGQDGHRSSQFTGRISTEGQQEITGAIQTTQALAGIYQSLGSPGLSAKDAQALNNGIAAAAVINQAFVGQQIPASAIHTGSPVVDAAMVSSIKPGATVTQSNANALFAATSPNDKAP